MLSYEIIDSKVFEEAKTKLVTHKHTRKLLNRISYHCLTYSDIQTRPKTLSQPPRLHPTICMYNVTRKRRNKETN